MDYNNVNLEVKVSYSNFEKEIFSLEEALEKLKDEEFCKNIRIIEFSYNYNMLDKNLAPIVREDNIRYVVGTKMGIDTFNRLIDSKSFQYLFKEADFDEKIKSANYVCAIRLTKEAKSHKFIGQFAVVDENTKVFDSVLKMINNAEIYLNSIDACRCNSFSKLIV